MSDTNDIIDQIENKVKALIAYVKANDKHFNDSGALIANLEADFEDFKASEYDTREDWEIAADAHGSRMCDKFHAKRDNKLTR